MQLQQPWLKPTIWGAVLGSILTMIIGFSWGGWTTRGTADQEALKRADAAVTATLVPICLAQGKIDPAKGQKLAELKLRSADEYELFKQAVAHLLMGLGGEDDKDTRARMQAHGEISDKDVVGAITAVLRHEAQAAQVSDRQSLAVHVPIHDRARPKADDPPACSIAASDHLVESAFRLGSREEVRPE